MIIIKQLIKKQLNKKFRQSHMVVDMMLFLYYNHMLLCCPIS